MSEQKHTPGPWDVSGLTVYDTCMDAVASTNSAADAILIATAPELLEACETMIAWQDAWDKDQGKAWGERLALCQLAFDRARCAIAKARGERA